MGIIIQNEEKQLLKQKEDIEAEYLEKRQRIQEQTQSMSDTFMQTLDLTHEKQHDEENKMLTNGLLYYSQRLQMYLNKGIPYRI